MPSSVAEEPRCQIVRTLEIVGEKWSLLIVRNAFRGQTTFSQFRDQLGIPSDILTARLSTLVEKGIFEKRSYRDAGNRQRASYHLTEAGQGLKLVMAAMNQWGDEFNPSPFGRASLWIDTAQDAEVQLTFVAATGASVSRDDVQNLPGPASTIQW